MIKSTKIFKENRLIQVNTHDYAGSKHNTNYSNPLLIINELILPNPSFFSIILSPKQEHKASQTELTKTNTSQHYIFVYGSYKANPTTQHTYMTTPLHPKEKRHQICFNM